MIEIMRKTAARVAAVVLLSLSAWWAPVGISAGLAQSPPPLGSLFGGTFELTDHDGMTRTNQDFRGQFMLIYFGYTYCPDICPANLQHMAAALDNLGDAADKVQPIFISIDPGRDTPEILKEYVSHFHPRLIGMTGTYDQIIDVVKSHRVHARKVVLKDQAADEYLVDHSSLTLMFDPKGKFLTLFPHDTKPDVMAQRMKKYLR